MKKSIKVIKQNQSNIQSIFKEEPTTDLVFRETQVDTIGKSGSHPTWGYTYLNKNRELKYKGIGLHKEYDYDAPNSAYSEKIWSIMGKKVLKDVRVPDIDIIEEAPGENGIISYRLLNNDKEDLIHIRDILFNMFEREEVKEQKDIFYIEDILKCAKIQVADENNYEKIKSGILQTLLLDSITNNGDRHANNWALVRDKEKGSYELADFDHSSAFVNMIEKSPYFTSNGWSSSYTRISPETKKSNVGDNGEQIIKYIAKNYKEEFEKFSINFDEALPSILEEIAEENLKIDIKQLERELEKRNHLLKTLRYKEEYTHEQ